MLHTTILSYFYHPKIEVACKITIDFYPVYGVFIILSHKMGAL